MAMDAWSMGCTSFTSVGPQYDSFLADLVEGRLDYGSIIHHSLGLVYNSIYLRLSAGASLEKK